MSSLRGAFFSLVRTLLLVSVIVGLVVGSILLMSGTSSLPQTLAEARQILATALGDDSSDKVGLALLGLTAAVLVIADRRRVSKLRQAAS